MKKRNLLLTGMISITLPLLSVSCIDNVQINQNDDNDQVKQYRQEGETLYIETEIINKDVIQKILEDESINREAVTKIYSRKAKLVSFQTTIDNISEDSKDILKFNFKNLKEIDLINVERIDHYAFTRIDSLISVNLPNVTEIGDEAFARTSSLETFSAPKLKKLGREVFYKAKLVKDIKDPLIIGKVLVKISPDLDKFSNTEVEYVADYVFGHDSFGGSSSNTRLKSINLPNVTEIERNAFQGAHGLEIVNLPNVTKIGETAFYGALLLKTFSAPKLKNVFFNSFMETPLLNEKLNQNENLIIGKVLVAVSPNTRELFNTEVEYVANFANRSNKVLTSVNLPNVTEIGEYAFYEASSLETFSAPKLKIIGKDAFKGTKVNLNSSKNN
ncbi:leucine-rich repeat protein [Mesomycoplasma molare]|uniref:Leucine-rich repeat domain-containing protein n=1 Tax=Mesomycoplasma molare TaxID=171288 RepID=A0ABY5TUQ9_9BACT|nr:leucine-rich repeat domain-containing protein [Mesomycoplasma molare]UWD34399.1 leucine-rich repeat domain-containing protein [Mesomycoplasma molare]